MGNIVLVGAGGTGMSGIAGLLHDLGYTNIVCVDGFQSELTDKLVKKGLKVIIGHEQYIPKIDDTIVYSEAVIDSFEVKKAREIAHEAKKTTLIMNYFQFLGEISKYFITVGFAGTNGKSSTTAMAITTAKELNPENTNAELGIGILGALVPQLDNQSHYLNPNHKDEIKSIFDFIFTGKFANREPLTATLIKKFYFFVEACEYKRHFLNLDLDYTIITSLELDHTDYYKDMDDYLDAFQSLIAKTKQKVFMPDNLEFQSPLGRIPESFRENLELIVRVPVQKINFKHIRGPHNDSNGSLVLALINECTKFSGPATRSSKLLEEFKGLWRRMELLGKNKNGAKIYTDYGHMASSIAGGYEALKQKYPDYKLCVIFQPHQINRILLGRNDFIKAIRPYDKVIIYDIYAARENVTELIKKFQSTHAGFKETINLQELGTIFAQECGGKYVKNREDVKKEIELTDSKTIIVVFSAGDIDYHLRSLDFIV